MQIAQLVPTLHSGDAIGGNSIALKTFFLSSGFESEIFYLEADSDVAHLGQSAACFSNWLRDDSESLTILHYALPSILNQMFRQTSGRKILVYHNITPPEFLRGYPHLQHISRVGRSELQQLRGITDLAVADSEYNRLELEKMGFENTHEIPILIDFDLYNSAPCPVTMKLFSDTESHTFLYVGRVTPNKCQHDLIRLYGFYKRFVNSRCRLIMVGKFDGFENYMNGCVKMADDLKLGDVFFTGKVTHRELLAYYRLASVFVSMSEHEGFGVPLIEAMYMDVPVLAFSAAAIPYTLSGAGIVFHRKERLNEIAELAHAASYDPEFRESIIVGQRKRLEYFTRRTISLKWNMILRVKLNMKAEFIPRD
jgi:L-malate glycosyltransferase